MLREILALFQVKADTSELEAANRKINDTVDRLKDLATVFAASRLAGAVAGFVQNQIQVGVELTTTAARLGVTTDALQQFNFAAETAGLSTTDAANSIRFLNRNLGAAIEGNKAAAQAFALLGVNAAEAAKGSPIEAFLKVADGMAKVQTHAERAALAQKVFGRGGQNMLPILEGGRKSIEKLFGEVEKLGGAYSEDYTRKAMQANVATVRMSYAMKSLRSVIGVELLPQATVFIDRLTGWIVKAQDFARHTFIINEALLLLKGVGIAGAIKSVLSLGRAFFSLFLGTTPLLWEFAALAAVGALLYIAFDEVFTLMSGGDSVLGQLLDKFGGVEGKEKFVNTLKKAWEDLKGIWDIGKQAIGDLLLEMGKVVVGHLPEIVDVMKALVKTILAAATGLVGLGAVAAKVATGDFKGAGKAIDKTGDAIFGGGGKPGLFGDGKPSETPFVGYSSADFKNGKYVGHSGASALPTPGLGDIQGFNPTLAPPAGISAPPTNTTLSQQNTVNVNVTTTSDPSAIGTAVGNGVRAPMGDALRDARDFVTRRAP